MKLKGDYNPETSYNVGDVVRNSEGDFYYLANPCSAGNVPTNSLYWKRLEGDLSLCAEMILNGVDMAEAKIPDNISKEAISLFDGDTECIITVDASGDTPELEVTVATEEGDT